MKHQRRVEYMVINSLVAKINHISDRSDAIQCVFVILRNEIPRLITNLDNWKDSMILELEKLAVKIAQTKTEPASIVIRTKNDKCGNGREGE